MRTLPAIASLLAAATVVAGAVALSTAAEARKQPRYYQPRAYQPYYYRPPRSYRAPRTYSWERLVCEENAQAADPTGLYAGYPCWARETFGRTPGGRGR
jgi:hypothetical protein